jgi:thioredoxin 1
MTHLKKSAVFLSIALVATLFISSCKSGNNGSKSENIIILSSENFTKETSSGVVMVDFWATWCMPCKAMAPVIDEIADQTKGKIKVGKVDVDASGDLANQFNVQGIPNIIIFKDGIPVENLVGIQSKETLIQALEKHVSLHD